MKLSTKVFTSDEIIIIRDALKEYKHFLKQSNSTSEKMIKNKILTQLLLDDFSNNN